MIKIGDKFKFVGNTCAANTITGYTYGKTYTVQKNLLTGINLPKDDGSATNWSPEYVFDKTKNYWEPAKKRVTLKPLPD